MPRLGNFHRASLGTGPTIDVPLDEEMELQRPYLDIERVRSAENLAVNIDVPGEFAQARVPSLVRQPLIENAIEHRINAQGRVMHLTLKTRRHRGHRMIEVADEGPGASRRSFTNVGLSKVRLTSRFGGEATMGSGRDNEGDFLVRLTFPLEAA